MNRTLRLQLTSLCIVGIALGLLPLAPGTNTIIAFLSIFFVYVTLTESWNLLAGYAGQLVLAAPVFFGIGAYAFSFLLVLYHIPVVLTLILAALVAAAVAGLLAAPLFRLRGDALAIGSLGLILIFGAWINAYGPLGGFAGFSITGVAYNSTYIYLLNSISSLIVLAAILVIIRSKFGRGLVAIRDDEGAAESLGVPVLRYKILILVISALFTGVAGGVWAYYVFYVSPDLFGILWMGIILVITIVGGIGTIEGPIIMSFVYVLLQYYLLSGYPVIDTVSYAVLLIVVVVVMPRGLAGSLHRGSTASHSQSKLLNFRTTKRERKSAAGSEGVGD